MIQLTFLEPPHKTTAKTSSETYGSTLAKEFKKSLNQSFIFHTLFFSLFIVEISLLIFLFLIQAASVFFAFLLSALFLSIFSYLLLVYYFKAKQSTHYLQIRQRFYHSLGEKQSEEMTPWLIESLSYIDLLFDYVSPRFKFFNRTIYTLNGWLHWKEKLRFKEAFILHSIKRHIFLIKKRPTEWALHATLASAFLSLADLYRAPKQAEPEFPFSRRFFEKEAIKTQRKHTILRALEELRIVQHSLPRDPWVHAQLARCYHDLELKAEEVKTYETLLQLRPNDKEILLRLGILYFKQGMVSQALSIYEELQELDAQKAQLLINFYDTEIEFLEDIMDESWNI